MAPTGWLNQYYCRWTDTVFAAVAAVWRARCGCTTHKTTLPCKCTTHTRKKCTAALSIRLTILHSSGLTMYAEDTIHILWREERQGREEWRGKTDDLTPASLRAGTSREDFFRPATAGPLHILTLAATHTCSVCGRSHHTVVSVWRKIGMTSSAKLSLFEVRRGKLRASQGVCLCHPPSTPLLGKQEASCLSRFADLISFEQDRRDRRGRTSEDAYQYSTNISPPLRGFAKKRSCTSKGVVFP